ncbi:MAG: hypothetical protein QHH75_07015 [Bacillota bacterium]|nr:hypothetical protein [Bacillota bacterium]
MADHLDECTLIHGALDEKVDESCPGPERRGGIPARNSLPRC